VPTAELFGRANTLRVTTCVLDSQIRGSLFLTTPIIRTLWRGAGLGHDDDANAVAAVE